MKTDLALADWVNWIACDADGSWWGFEAEPHQHDHGWYENEVGRYIKLSQQAANTRWEQTLQPAAAMFSLTANLPNNTQ